MTTEKLDCRYSSQKSFGGKAVVEYNDNGTKTLHSYRTVVARIIDGKAKVYAKYSDTSVRHIREFLLQQGFKADTKKQIMKDYYTEEK